MDIVRLSSSMSENKYASDGSALVARKKKDLQGNQERKATPLIHRSAPDFMNGNGKLVNLYA